VRCNASCGTHHIEVEVRQADKDERHTFVLLVTSTHLTRSPMTVKPDAKRDRHRRVHRRRAVTVFARPTALATGAALILAAVGCGGSGKGTSSRASTVASSAPATPTKAEYVAKANAICAATNGPLAATALRLASHPSRAEAAHIIASTFIPQIKSQLSQIQAIGVPAGGQAASWTMDRLLAGDIARIEKNPAIAGPAAFHDFAEVAHGYGLTACAPLS
jgi:hypothetical protein